MRHTNVASILLALCAAAPPTVFASQSSQAGSSRQIAIYVTPFYNSEGPEVNVGEFSEDLASADRESIRQVAEAMQQEWDSLPVVAVYVAAIRLYDLGFRDEAVRWFYEAQYRARLFQEVVDPSRIGGIGSPAFELKAAHAAFWQLAGPHVNGYAGCDRDKWLGVLESVRAGNTALPKFGNIYPSVAFIPADQWAAKNAEVASGLAKLIEYIESNGPEFESRRAENNMDEKFCGAG